MNGNLPAPAEHRNECETSVIYHKDPGSYMGFRYLSETPVNLSLLFFLPLPVPPILPSSSCPADLQFKPVAKSSIECSISVSVNAFFSVLL